MKVISLVASLSSVFINKLSTNPYHQPYVIGRYPRSPSTLSSALTTLISPLLPRFVRSFAAGSASTSTSTNLKSNQPMASRLSEKVIDHIAEEPEDHFPWKVYPACQYDFLVENHGIQNVKLIYTVRHAEGTHNVNEDYKSIEQLDARLTPLGKDQCRELRDEILHWEEERGEMKSDDSTVVGKCRDKSGWKHLMNGSKKKLSDEEGDGNNGGDVCVVASPMTRCIQTALLSFDFFTPAALPREQSNDDDSGSDCGNRVPFICIEALRETVNYNCDRRRRISEVANDFPQIDFSFCENEEDKIWNSYQEEEKERKSYLESAQLYVVADRGRQALKFLQTLPQSKIVVCTHSAYLRCILNWGHTGGVPKAPDQSLDDREDPTRQDKLFEYCIGDQKSGPDQVSFEEYMRKDYENAEMRSFCLLVR